MKNIQIKQAAIISKDIYGHPFTIRTVDAKIINQKRFDFSSANGWRRIENFDQQIVSNNPFFAALYIKFTSGRAEAAAIAFRGTVPSDISNDLEGSKII